MTKSTKAAAAPKVEPDAIAHADLDIGSLTKQILTARRSILIASPEELKNDYMVRLSGATKKEMVEKGIDSSVPSDDISVAAQNSIAAAQSAMHSLYSPNAVVMLAAPTYTDDVDLTIWLGQNLPDLIKTFQDVFSSRPANFIDLWNKIQKASTAISGAIQKGLPNVKGVEAKALVTSIVDVLFNSFVAPMVGPIMAMMIRSSLPGIIQFVYENLMKGRK